MFKKERLQFETAVSFWWCALRHKSKRNRIAADSNKLRLQQSCVILKANEKTENRSQ